ncbi:S8 family peptidase [Bradyrhizobium sp. SBR1B]|uniref:S8 family peptidase n=1 Tax=Bradyrhizobium sp. SBR1B TaxID=2663836 RepID=UPI0018584FE9|nr:S8 family peptidase [Bradyrhizobium sp. SBR1B]MBB4380438.1 subtilisin family serine protease [Bradyrhizobium sp. SBR1B]
MTMEEDWERLGLTLLASDEDKTLILFASTDDLQAFRDRLQAYSLGIPPGQVAPSYSGFISRIESIGAVEPRDRIGVRLREEGFSNPADFATGRSLVLDLELWDVGRRDVRMRKLEQVADYVDARGGEVLDRYIGPSITMLRARMAGDVIQALLAVEDVTQVDLPPEPDVATGEALELTIADLPQLEDIAGEPPVIGIIDSGVNDHPLLQGAIVGAIGSPERLGSADDWGHGTRVAGIALFGDFKDQLAAGALIRAGRIASAKVVNDRGQFDERRLVPSQMREALTTLHERFGCRLFVIALGDPKRPYDGGKVGPWAATLDELARELDAVIVVSAGNRAPRGGNRLEQAITDYPSYLLEPTNRLCEPAGAMNVLTVGALAHGEGVDSDLAEHLHIRPITRAFEPAPFTRVGPGIGGALKPDLVDIGGTMVFDPAVGRLRLGEDLATAGVLTLHHRFTDRLFTSGSGTSYAAPRVAHKAAQILNRFPAASANLLRALLTGAARVPEEAQRRLQVLGEDAVRSVCGNGAVDTELAAYSDDHRVVLYAEDELAIDHFAIYQLPVPEPFQSGGRRSIRVTLAFDPPVRHTRADYAGIGMNFRLVRGCDPDLIFEHFRRRTQEEGRQPDLDPRYNCALDPGPRERERGTLQSATVTFTRGTEAYGDNYYLVVRCEGGWAASFETRQRFAVVVELTHQAEVRLYERLRARIQL